MRILYLDLDALSPRHLSCYGYHRKTSPTIDMLAARGVRMNQVYCADAPCMPSRTGFYSGRLGIQSGVVGHGGIAGQPKVEGPTRNFRDNFDNHGLAAKLQQAGFHTAMISPFGQRHSAHWFYAGFHEIHNTGFFGSEPAEKVMPVVESWLKNNVEKDNWFLHLNFWDIHTPYRTPLEYGDPFKDEPLPAWITDEVLASHIKKTGPHSASDLGMYADNPEGKFPRIPKRIIDRETLAQWINGYDTAIKYVDDQIALIIERLKAAGVYEDTLFIVSADHGENQGELGLYGEHATADDATCRIPMIIAGPGIVSGIVDKELHYQLDLAPTLMDLLNRPKPEIWDGQSYVQTLKTGAPQGREELVISQCAHVCQRSVRWGPWLYMRTYHDGLHFFPDEMLFNLKDDPHEQHDLAKQNPQLCMEGAWRLARWHETQMKKMALYFDDISDPMWTVYRHGGPLHCTTGFPGNATPLVHKYAKRLEETGRADGAAKLRERYKI